MTVTSDKPLRPFHVAKATLEALTEPELFEILRLAKRRLFDAPVEYESHLLSRRDAAAYFRCSTKTLQRVDTNHPDLGFSSLVDGIRLYDVRRAPRRLRRHRERKLGNG